MVRINRTVLVLLVKRTNFCNMNSLPSCLSFPKPLLYHRSSNHLIYIDLITILVFSISLFNFGFFGFLIIHAWKSAGFPLKASGLKLASIDMLNICLEMGTLNVVITRFSKKPTRLLQR